MRDYFSETSLAKSPPIKRAAYSDRTAWILSEISRLVYQPLPGEVTVKALVDEIRAAVQRGEHDDALEALLQKATRAGVSTDSQIADELRKADFELLDPFAIEGTEALLAKLAGRRKSDGMLVLAFRGTQPSVKDIMTDIKADLVPASAPASGQVHRGFLEAYSKVADEISRALDKHRGLPLYITGHSLGGALALVATRYLGSDSTGATYTYGCPRVADDVFFEPVKTPVYRVVNAADGVTRLPFGYALVLLLSLIRLVPLNGTRWISEWIRRRFVGYTHYGSLVFLSAPPNTRDEHGIPYKGLVVKKSPDIFWRVALVVRRAIATRGKAFAGDHAKELYSDKLLAHARRRNLE